MEYTQLGKQIYDEAVAAGFDSCGIIPIDKMDGFLTRLKEREERVPSSAGFYESLNFGHVRQRFPWAKAVVICTYWLGKYRYPQSLQGKYAKSFFLSPSNSCCMDMQKKCQQLEAWFANRGIHAEGGNQFSQISIGPLRYAAMMAGLGIIRKNNFLYTEKGSFIELVGYVIDEECLMQHTPKLRPCADTCHLCQQNCPSKALKGPFTMSPLECVSFITTFAKGQLPEGMDDSACGTWICGCDSCQDACPYNRFHDWNTGAAYPGLEELASKLQPETLLKQTDEFIQQKVIPYTDYHVAKDEAQTLRICADRSIRNQH